MGKNLLIRLGIPEDEFVKILTYFKAYFRNPVQAIRFLPNWNWPTALLLTGFFAALSGGLSGIVALSPTQTIIGILFFPISVTIGHILISGFFYYTLFFFVKRQLDFLKLFTLILLASLPALALNIVASHLTPLNLIGVFVSCILLVVGLTDNFLLNRKSTMKMVFSIYLIFVILWIFSALNSEHQNLQQLENIQPESLDILEQELKK